MLVCWILLTCVCERLLGVMKSPCQRRISPSEMIPWRVLRTLARTKTSLTEPFDHIAPMCMIVSSRAWLGWFLHYDLHYSLIVVSCLACILWSVYALIWGCICYMIFIWLLNAWVILLVVEYSDDEYGGGRVSATVGVDLRSRAIVVIDLSSRVGWGLRNMVVSTSHLTFFRTTSRPCMGRA
jgi:hypothetical protein